VSEMQLPPIRVLAISGRVITLMATKYPQQRAVVKLRLLTKAFRWCVLYRQGAVVAIVYLSLVVDLEAQLLPILEEVAREAA
jgi:hypothetical protein